MTESYVVAGLAMIAAAMLLAFWLAPGGVLALRRRAGELQVDVRVAYSAGTLYRLLDAYGEEGRRQFRRMLHVDMLFPAVYGTTLFLCGDLLDSSSRAAMPATLAQCAAIAAAAFDYSENMFLLSAVRLWRERPRSTAWMASLFTTLKMAALGFTVACLAAAALAS